jgi:hypothetical protein
MGYVGGRKELSATPSPQGQHRRSSEEHAVFVGGLRDDLSESQHGEGSYHPLDLGRWRGVEP